MKSTMQSERDAVAKDLPSHFTTDKEPEKIEMPVGMTIQRPYSPEMIERFRSLGLTPMRLDRMGAMSELGKVAKELGVVEQIKGNTLFTQESLVVLLEKVRQMAESPKTSRKDMLLATQAAVKIAFALSHVNVAAVKVDQTVVQVVDQADQVRRRSFQPGMAVQQPKAV